MITTSRLNTVTKKYLKKLYLFSNMRTFVTMHKTINLIIQELSKPQREQKIHLLEEDLSSGSWLVDCGVWCKMPEPNPSENWLEKQYGAHAKIIAVGLDNLIDFKKKYPDVLCVQADGCALPFKNRGVDVAFSNAVLEHIPQQQQIKFIEEISRIASKKAILTVPDHLSPIEIHSKIFFLHWLPNWRRIFSRVGENYWSKPENLSTIFSKTSLSRLLMKSSIPGVWKIKRQSLWGIPVSLIATYMRAGD